jgi:hypothetical protein
MKELPGDAVATPKVAIDWYRSTPWWRIASQCIVISWRSTHILLCALALLLTQAWTSVSHYLFDNQTLPQPNWIQSQPLVELDLWSFSKMSPAAVLSLGANACESFIDVWRKLLLPIFSWLHNPTLGGAANCIAALIGILAIWSWVGGALARRSVVELGTRMTAPWAETFRLVTKRWQSIVWSVTMPSGLILLMSIVPLILGWISNIPAIGPWVAGLLLVPMVLGSLAIGWCGAITVFGFPLSVAAIVTEKQADAYDGISRSAAYTFQRPLTLALCVLAAQLLGAVGGTMVSIVLSTGYSVIDAGFSVGSFATIAGLDSFWMPVLARIIPLLLTAYSFSFFWTAAAASYLILRRDVDHAEFDLIDLAANGEPKSLPELPKNEVIATETNSGENVADQANE